MMDLCEIRDFEDTKATMQADMWGKHIELSFKPVMNVEKSRLGCGV